MRELRRSAINYIEYYTLIRLDTTNTFTDTLFSQIVETSLGLIFVGIIGILIFGVNIILVLISIEIMLLGVNRQLVIYSLNYNDIIGQVLSLMVLTVAAAESAIGLGIVVVYYRTRGNIVLYSMNNIHG